MGRKNGKKTDIKAFMGRVGRIVLVMSAGLLICVFILIGWLLALSPGKPKPFLDENGRTLTGSISEKIYVNINGVEQGMFIKGKDKTKPVLLFLHGGPGMPEYGLSRQYPLVLEDCFTVCWWEQRGAGLSYSPDITLETMTFEQLIADTLAVTHYLRNRFQQDKIYLMAHSGGTFIGIQAAARAPELYEAYIAMAQITNQLESEKLAYEYMIEQFTELKDNRMLQKFKKFPVTEINTQAYYTMRDNPMHRLGVGTTHNMRSVISGVFWPIMLHPEYTLSEKIDIWRGKFFTTKTANLWSKLVEEDLTLKVNKLEIPVYFCHGIYDYTTSYKLAKNYLEQLEAPRKAFYTFLQSAHSPLFEEPEKMLRILQADVLQGLNNLSDTD